MKARVPIAVLAVLAAIVVIVLVSSGGGSSGGALDPVAQAAGTTTRVDGARVSLSGTVSASSLGTQITIRGQGAFNFAAHDGSLTLSVGGLPANVSSQLPGGSLEVEELFKSGSVYIGSSLFAGKLPSGARWVRLDLARVQHALGLDPSSLTSGGADPTQYLQYLKQAGGSKIVGHDAVRGVATTHYAGSIDLLKAAEAVPGSDRSQVRAAVEKLSSQSGLHDIPVGVWVDARGLVRKVSITASLAASAQQADVAIDMEFYDFGSTPSVRQPASSEVFDMTGQALQNISPLG